MITSNQIEEHLKYYLQRDIQFILNKSVVREGKLILFKPNVFYLSFFLKIKNRNKHYEIPCPYEVIVEEGRLLFNYTINALRCEDIDMHLKLNSQYFVKKSKYYNQTLVLQSLQ